LGDRITQEAVWVLLFAQIRLFFEVRHWPRTWATLLHNTFLNALHTTAALSSSSSLT
jgi:hypothetical protein